jgi:hypothetical protein
MSFVSWLSVIIGYRIQLTLSVLGGSLIFLTGRICLQLYGRCCNMYLDLSKECLKTEFGVAVCELQIFKLSTVVVCWQIKSVTLFAWLEIVDGRIYPSFEFQHCRVFCVDDHREFVCCHHCYNVQDKKRVTQGSLGSFPLLIGFYRRITLFVVCKWSMNCLYWVVDWITGGGPPTHA